ncbi:MAG TPA: pca operon transcription factor PcaQ [Bauldia sp.]|nr:pca operon transcription factor PcaQ [Bauldia sp.]
MARLVDPRIKLRHIVCFLEVARLKSVVKAAHELNMSQPAASKTIQELEEILGVPLFDRSRRNLFLSPAGESFQRHSTASIAALRQGVDSVLDDNAPTVVRVGSLPTVSAMLLPRAVQRFTSEQKRYRVRVTTGPSDYLLSLLRAGELDVIIGRMADPGDIAALAFEHLYAERVVFVVRRGHPLLKRRRFRLSAIADYQILMPSPGAVILPSVERLLTAHGVTNLRDDIQTVAVTFGRRYTATTDAVWIISEGVVAEDVEAGELALLPVDTSETYGAIGLTARSGERPGEGIALFLDHVREIAAGHVPI